VRPLLLPLLACAAAVAVHAADKPQRPRERSLRERVCSEGAYLRGPRAAAGRLQGAARVEGGEQGGEDSGLFRFTPPKEGCEQAVSGFFTGPGAGFEIAPAFETGPGGARVELRPEEASRRMVRLASLSRVAESDPRLAARFFDNRLSQGDVTAMAGLDRQAGLALAPGLSSYVSDGGRRVPFAFTERPRVRGVSDDTAVPPLGEPRPLQPSRPWNVPPEQVPPAEYSRPRQWFNNAVAEVRDAIGGGPINAWEGGRTVLPQTTPVDVPPGSPSTQGFVQLPNAPGLRHNCRPGCWGTPRLVQLITAMGQQFDQYFPGQGMAVGHLSLPQGGRFPPHVSHQVGLDVDISFVGGTRGFDVQRNTMIVASVVRFRDDFVKQNGRQYILVDASKHAALTWGLDRLVAEGNLTAEQRNRAVGALTHWPHHNDHFHVRVLPGEPRR
jgi:hypothetical protein